MVDITGKSRLQRGMVDITGKSQLQLGMVNITGKSRLQRGMVDITGKSQLQWEKVDITGKSRLQLGMVDITGKSRLQWGKVDITGKLRIQQGMVDITGKSWLQWGKVDTGWLTFHERLSLHCKQRTRRCHRHGQQACRSPVHAPLNTHTHSHINKPCVSLTVTVKCLHVFTTKLYTKALKLCKLCQGCCSVTLLSVRIYHIKCQIS